MEQPAGGHGLSGISHEGAASLSCPEPQKRERERFSWQNFRNFGRDANIIVSLSFLGSIAGGIIGLCLALYLQALGYNYATIGILLAIGTVAGLVSILPAGMLSDRYGKKPMLILSGFFGAAAGVLLVLSSNIYALAAASALNGLSGSFAGPAQNAFMADITTEKRRKYLFTLTAFSGTLGAMAGMLIGGVLPSFPELIHRGDSLYWFRALFLVATAIAVARTLGFFAIAETKPRHAKTGRILPGSWATIRLFIITSVFVGFGAGLVIPWFQIYFRDKFGIPYSSIGYLFALQQLIMAFLTLLMPLLAARWGSVKAIVATQGLAVVVLVTIPTSPIFSIVAAAFIIRAILMNVAGPIQGAFQMCIIPESDRASASAYTQLAWTASWAAGTFAAGYIMEWSLDAPFFITAGFYTAYVLLFFVFFRKYKNF